MVIDMHYVCETVDFFEKTLCLNFSKLELWDFIKQNVIFDHA